MGRAHRNRRTQTSLTDEGPISSVTRSVNWGDGTAAEPWTTGDTINHLYAADGLYRPTVTLTDGVGELPGRAARPRSCPAT